MFETTAATVQLLTQINITLAVPIIKSTYICQSEYKHTSPATQPTHSLWNWDGGIILATICASLHFNFSFEMFMARTT